MAKEKRVRDMKIKPLHALNMRPRLLARAVIKHVAKTGEKPNMLRLQRQFGYSEKSALRYKGTVNRSYRREMQGLAERLQAEIDRAVGLMPKKIKNAKYRDLTDSIDKLTKTRRLISGESTDNVAQSMVFLPRREIESLPDGDHPGEGAPA